jgi:hypothetical protein
MHAVLLRALAVFWRGVLRFLPALVPPRAAGAIVDEHVDAPSSSSSDSSHVTLTFCFFGLLLALALALGVPPWRHGFCMPYL